VTLIQLSPRAKAKVDEIIGRVGEAEFRRRVAMMTHYDTETLSLDDVIAVFVAERQGRVHPPEAGRRAVARFPTLPPATADDPCVDLSRRAGQSSSIALSTDVEA
jgi:hypothetical protein